MECDSMKSVLIVGLGAIGSATAKYYKEKGCTVWGWDVDYRTSIIAEATLDIIVYDSFDDYGLDAMDVISICVPTDVVYDVSKQIFENLNRMGYRENLLYIIESTMIPGMSRKIWKNVFEKKLGIAHVPQRYWGKDPKNRGIRRTRVVSASDEATLANVVSFLWSVDMPIFCVESLEIAELSKVAENAYRYVLIAYAEELSNVCRALKIDFRAVKEAIESHKFEDYVLEPIDGIGGHCLPMAADIMTEISEFNSIIKAAKEADEIYRKLK